MTADALKWSISDNTIRVVIIVNIVMPILMKKELKKMFELHDPESALLIGNVQPQDQIRVRRG